MRLSISSSHSVFSSMSLARRRRWKNCCALQRVEVEYSLHLRIATHGHCLAHVSKTHGGGGGFLTRTIASIVARNLKGGRGREDSFTSASGVLSSFRRR